MNKSSDFLIDQFRKLGGKFENIKIEKCNFGRGIFSKNHNLKSRIFVPRNLMININDIYLFKNKLLIKKNNQTYDQELVNFYNLYLDKLCWDEEIWQDLDSFEKDLIAFNSTIRTLLKNFLLIDIDKRHKRLWNDVLLKSFIDTRKFKFCDSSMICPFLDLINHKTDSLSCLASKDGIYSPNYPPFSNELTINYKTQGSIKRLFQYKFLNLEPNVFSFPFSFKIEDSGILFLCNGCEPNRNCLSIKKDANKVIIDGLQIAFNNNQNYLFEQFHKISEAVEVNIPNSLIERIIKYNISMRQIIKKEVNFIKNKTSKQISIILQHEINFIKYQI